MRVNSQQCTRSSWLRGGARLFALFALALLAVLLAAPPTHAQSPGYTQVSAGFRNTCALKTDGSIECWGDNLFGQSKDQAGAFLQVAADSYHSCAIRNAGQSDRDPVTCWGYSDEGQASPPAGDFLQISAGEDYTCGVTGAGNIDCWGTNSYGQARDQNGPYLQTSLTRWGAPTTPAG